MLEEQRHLWGGGEKYSNKLLHMPKGFLLSPLIFQFKRQAEHSARNVLFCNTCRAPLICTGVYPLGFFFSPPPPQQHWDSIVLLLYISCWVASPSSFLLPEPQAPFDMSSFSSLPSPPNRTHTHTPRTDDHILECTSLKYSCPNPTCNAEARQSERHASPCLSLKSPIVQQASGPDLNLFAPIDPAFHSAPAQEWASRKARLMNLQKKGGRGGREHQPSVLPSWRQTE